ncbi:MAG TPA: hypothetical protein VIJ68_01755 [Candidatus Saccharimonadales bacterium]
MRLSNGRHDRRSLWDKIWRTRAGDIVIFQMPNIWLIIWVVLTCISLLASSHNMANTFWWLSSAVLAIWALLEIFKGVNYFRRALGVFILLLTIGTLFGIGL